MRLLRVILHVIFSISSFPFSVQAVEKSPLKPPTIAVLNFSATKTSNAMANASNVVQDELTNSQKFLVTDRKAMDQILKEQAFQKSGCTTQECAVEIGKILNCKFMVVGEINVLGGEFQLSVRVIDVETTQVSFSKIEWVDSEKDLRFAAVRLVESIATKVGLKPIDHERVAPDYAKDLEKVSQEKIELEHVRKLPLDPSPQPSPIRGEGEQNRSKAFSDAALKKMAQREQYLRENSKSPVIAGILGLVFTGAGKLYIGKHVWKEGDKFTASDPVFATELMLTTIGMDILCFYAIQNPNLLGEVVIIPLMWSFAAHLLAPFHAITEAGMWNEWLKQDTESGLHFKFDASMPSLVYSIKF